MKKLASCQVAQTLLPPLPSKYLPTIVIATESRIQQVPYALHPTSYTLHPALFTLHPTSHTLRPAPHTLSLTPHTLHSTPYTAHPATYTLHPTPYTLHPLPNTIHPTPVCVIHVLMLGVLLKHSTWGPVPNVALAPWWLRTLNTFPLR